ncbi:hypothetical protein [Aquimarina pacifica]|uniref:hypothetical protein n=1 Tax=Aquimarina pacifica TaxID=1296415 RepID=UPI00047000BE|nr:hypothetical protein [Aquimarina pacifica]
MKKYIALALCISLILSCSNDDDQCDCLPIDGIGLDGQWHLTHVSGGFLGIDESIDKGIIIWDFNEENMDITITNMNTDNSLPDILASGIYDYSIITLEDDYQELRINGSSFGNFELIDTKFTLNELFKDGYLYTFQR